VVRSKGVWQKIEGNCSEGWSKRPSPAKKWDSLPVTSQVGKKKVTVEGLIDKKKKKREEILNPTCSLAPRGGGGSPRAKGVRCASSHGKIDKPLA